MGGWTKREAVSNLTMLGDSEGQIKKCGGLLAAIHADPNPKFKNFIYELVQKNGESLNLAGSASLTRQINETDIGHFVRCEFEGWGDSPNGKFKKIAVQIYEGEANADMKAWPRFSELQGGGATPKVSPKAAPAKAAPAADDFSDFPEGGEASDDEMPF